jgi:DNA-binding transcriptional MerR regulator
MHAQSCVYTMGQLARRYGCQSWQVRRLFERGLLPPASRVGPYRVVSEADLPAVEFALQKAGYIPARESSPNEQRTRSHE